MITEENFLDFKCPYCGELNSFPRDSAGFVRECVNCREALIVPEEGSEVGLKIPIPITTSKLVLRRLIASDQKDLVELFSDEEIFLYDNRNPPEEEEIMRWLESEHHVKLTTPDEVFFLGIEAKDGGKLVGELALRFTDSQRLQAQLTIWVNRNHRRKGFGLEAVAAILGFCFEQIHLHRVTAMCDTQNTAACRLCEKAGLNREGESVKDRFVRGEWMSSVWYAALEDEYGESGCSPAEESST